MTTYEQVAGTRVDRIAGLSDALFAIALTLTVLEVKVPGHQAIMTESQLRGALIHMAPRVLTYLLSFMTLGIYWVGQQTLLNHLQRSNRHMTWLHLAFLATIAVMPVSAGLLAEYITYRIAIVLYWLNILATGVVSLVTLWYAERTGLLDGRLAEEAVVTLKRRNVIGQALYALGAALCFIHTYWSIAFIVVVQAWFAFGPRLPHRMQHPHPARAGRK
jgi:uncharacterized membrane protein